jgi:hypothetical protein
MSWRQGLALLRAVWENYRAYRQGLRRIVPYRAENGQIISGRIYAPRSAGRVKLTAEVTRSDGTREIHIVKGP